MDIIIVILAFILSIVGVLGAIIPALPGPPLSFVAMLLLLVCDGYDMTTAQVMVAAVFAVIITILDYVAPIWLTNKRGGSKYGIWGAGIGMFVGLFMGPLGIIIAPFIGALIGELYAGTKIEKAFGIAFMSFLAFMLTTGLKVIYCVVLFAIVAYNGWMILWQ